VADLPEFPRDEMEEERWRAGFVRHRAALMVFGGAGLRLSEGCALRREGIDPRGYLRVLGKGGHEDIVPVEDSVVAAIQEVLRHLDTGTTQIYTQMAREGLRKKLPRRFIDYQESKLV
jgi:site-specific recombinase XerD